MKRFILLTFLASSLFAQTQITVTTIYQQPGVISASDLAQSFIASVDKQVSKQNSDAAGVISQGCQDWTANNLHNRDLGLPLTLKPVGSPVVHLKVTITGPTAGPLLVTMATSAGPDTLGVCPDLPNLPVPKPNTFELGHPLSTPPGWYSVGPTDTVPANGVAKAPDGGMYYKHCIPFGCYYIQITGGGGSITVPNGSGGTTGPQGIIPIPNWLGSGRLVYI